MTSIVNKLVEGGHLTDEQVERIGESVHEFVKAAEADPRLMQEYVEKCGLSWRDYAAIGGIQLGATGAAALGQLGLEKLQEVTNDRQKAKRYKEMMDATPELRARGVNAKMVQRHFNTLNTFNPSYAADPTVAGAWVQNQLEAARPNIEALNTIVRARRDRVESHKPPQVMEQVLKPISAAMIADITAPGPEPLSQYERTNRLDRLQTIHREAQRRAKLGLTSREEELLSLSEQQALRQNRAAFMRLGGPLIKAEAEAIKG